MTKTVAKLGEEGKVALRNVRRDAMKAAEKLEKDGAISGAPLALPPPPPPPPLLLHCCTAAALLLASLWMRLRSAVGSAG